MIEYHTVTEWEGPSNIHYVKRQTPKYPRDLPTLCGRRGNWYTSLIEYPICQVCYVLRWMEQ